jgi:tetratricopeptide (TPR) repeat protein
MRVMPRSVPSVVLVLGLVAATPAIATAQFANTLSKATEALRGGQAAEAEQLLRSLLVEVGEQGNDERKLTVLTTLGYALRIQGKDSEAWDVYGDAVVIFESLGQTSNPAYGATLATLGTLAEQLSWPDVAEERYLQALEVFEAAGSSQQLNAATTLANVGNLYTLQGGFEQARRVYFRAANILESTAGAPPGALAITLNNLAMVEDNLGNKSEAQAFYIRAIQLREQQWGTADARLATAIANLGTHYRRDGDVVTAESLYVRAIEILDRQTEPDPVARVPILVNLGQAYERQRFIEDAIDVYEEVVDLFEIYSLANDELYAIAASALGAYYITDQRYADAEVLLDDALAAMTRAYGEDYEGLVRLLERQAIVYDMTERPDEARIARDRANVLLGEDDVADPAAPRMAEPPSRQMPESQAPPPPVEAEPGRIYTPSDTAQGRRLLTVRPRLISCPRYDPSERTARQRIGDRYEREQELERAPVNVEARLELVINVGGMVEPSFSKVLETTDPRVDDRILQWVRSCQFTPGKIGDQAVRVRIEFPIKYSFVRS